MAAQPAATTQSVNQVTLMHSGNADSNTRQRDVCTLDAYLQTLYQAGTFPTTAFHQRRRVTQFMFEYLGYVNTWTEFLISPIGFATTAPASKDGLGLVEARHQAIRHAPHEADMCRQQALL